MPRRPGCWVARADAARRQLLLELPGQTAPDLGDLGQQVPQVTRVLCGGIERFTGLAILAALSIVAAVLQAAQAIGHLIVLGLLAAAVDAAFQGGR
jgi:hypothetical protein